MVVKEFLEKFYTDEQFKDEFINKLSKIESIQTNENYLEHYKSITNLYENILFESIATQLYSTKGNIKIGEML